jgi:hypothetical protein
VADKLAPALARKPGPTRGHTLASVDKRGNRGLPCVAEMATGSSTLALAKVGVLNFVCRFRHHDDVACAGELRMLDRSQSKL